MPDSSPKQVPPYGLRMPPELKARVAKAAEQSNQSINALIVSALERAFPVPTIDLHDLGAFLAGLSDEEPEDLVYLEKVNAVLAGAKFPWTVRIAPDGRVIFYPGAWKPGDPMTLD